MSDGSCIRVFQDPWVLGISEFKVIWNIGSDWNMCVADLITKSGCWNMERLEQVGTLSEVNVVLSIPLAHMGSRD